MYNFVDYMMIVSLTDPSFTESFGKLKCVLFAKEVEKLPAVKSVGDIVRFHRLMVRDMLVLYDLNTVYKTNRNHSVNLVRCES